MSSKGLRDRKAQASSAELLMAYFIFFLALTMAVLMWTNFIDTIDSRERLTDFEDLTGNIAEKLVRTPGDPSNWSSDHVSAIGLAYEPRTLGPEKILAFIDLMNDSKPSTACPGISNYECNKHLLGVGKHEFFLALKETNWTDPGWTESNWTIVRIGDVNCTAGKYPVDDVERLTVRRTALFRGNVTRLEFTLWHNETGAL
jgi:hypothetical protein